MKATFLYFIDQVSNLSNIYICRLCVHFSMGSIPRYSGFLQLRGYTKFGGHFCPLVETEM